MNNYVGWLWKEGVCFTNLSACANYECGSGEEFFGAKFKRRGMGLKEEKTVLQMSQREGEREETQTGKVRSTMISYCITLIHSDLFKKKVLRIIRNGRKKREPRAKDKNRRACVCPVYMYKQYNTTFGQEEEV